MSRRPTLLTALAATAFAAAPGGCGGGATDYTLSIWPRAPDGRYQAAAPGDPLDILVGTQLYQFARVKARTSPGAPHRLDFELDLAIDGMPDYLEQQKDVAVDPADPDGLSASFFVLFNHLQPLDPVIGRRALITFTSNGGRARAAIDVVLSHRPGCLEKPDGSVACP